MCFTQAKRACRQFAPNHNRKNGTMLYLDGHAAAMKPVNRDLPTAAGYRFPKRNDL
ncbi:MAG: hypothetical protein E7054_04990 [Lentisphaerae bacterium]|nr:hypothetical protein [Lentisphaerota bacterium]